MPGMTASSLITTRSPSTASPIKYYAAIYSCALLALGLSSGIRSGTGSTERAGAEKGFRCFLAASCVTSDEGDDTRAGRALQDCILLVFHPLECVAV